MGRDVALLDRARKTREAVFSIYEWMRPTLSLGRNQIARDQYDRDVIRSAGVDVVRRPTGGRALLHYHEVTYSVTAPVGSTSLRESYEGINRILLNGLARLGVDASVATGGAMEAPGPVPCFSDPAAGELVVNGRKLVGSAQLRDGGAFLQHGSILIEDDQGFISQLMLGRASNGPVPGAATLSSILARKPRVDEVSNALFDAVRHLEDQEAEHLSEDEVRADCLVRAREFENELWTWRR
jgi:lipoate-protein ligase A